MARSKTTEIPTTSALRDLQLRQTQISNNPAAAAFYAFYLVNLRTGKPERYFGFDMPPQSVDMQEDAAAEAIPLQEDGVHTDERGQFFKTVNLSGTFGFRPTNRTAADAFGLSRSAAEIGGAIASITGAASPHIPESERTGFDRYRDLHNMIRAYWDLKASRNKAAHHIFVYADWRKGEVYACQPLTFRRTETAPSNRYKTNWSLSLRLLYPLDALRAAPDTLFKPDSYKGVAGALERIRGVARLLSALNRVITRTITQLRDLGFDVVTRILEPVRAFTDLIAGVVPGVNSLLSFPADVLRSVHRDCVNVASLVDAAGTASDLLDGSRYKRMAALLAQVFVDARLILEQGTVANLISQTATSRKRFPHETTSQNELGERMPRAPSNSSASQSRAAEQGSIRITVPRDTSVRQLAAQQLNDTLRWVEIVALNQLEYPYISPDGDGVSVKRPGDDLLLPAPIDTSSVNNVYAPDVERDLEALRYGRDLLIDTGTGDLPVDASGDLATIEGMSNVQQAIALRFQHEIGSLILHPTYGFDAGIGQGIKIDSTAAMYFQARKSCLADPRIATVPYLQVSLRGDVGYISGTLQPIDGDATVSLIEQVRVAQV